MTLDLRDKKILAIDDEPEILDFIKEFLESHYYHVLTATNGLDGLKILKNNKIDLILLDIAMPFMNGIEVLSEIKKNPDTSQIPVIMLTARMETGMILKAQELGARDYITKPFQPEELLKWVKVYERYDPKKP